MSTGAGNHPELVLEGTLEHTQIEGGAWILLLDDERAELGDRIVLDDVAAWTGAQDGARARVTCVPRPDLVDIAMAGTRVEVVDLQLIDPA